MPAPKQKYNELVDVINTIAQQQPVDQVAVARVRAEAKRLLNSDPASAHVVLGILAGLEGKVDAVREHFRVALEVSPSARWARSNHVNALVSVAEFRKAARLAAVYSAEAPLDVELLRLALGLNMTVGSFRQAKTLSDRLRLLLGAAEEAVQDVDQVLKIMKDESIVQEEIERAVDVAIEIARGRKLSPDGSQVTVENDDDRFLSIELKTRVPASEIADLNFELANLLAAEPSFSRPDKVIISFAPMK